MAKYLALLACLMFGMAAQAETLVLLPGLGDGAGSFGKLLRQLPDDTPVYDRGLPKVAAGSKTPGKMAAALASGLKKSGAEPPYVLVAHSVAAPVALAFASAHPDLTKGVVLIDPRLPGFAAACEAAGLSLCRLPKLLRLSFPAYQLALADAVDGMALGAQSRPNVPVSVLTAGRAPAGLSADWAKVWQTYHRDYVASLAQGRQVMAAKSRHYIHRDATKLVAREILQMLP